MIKASVTVDWNLGTVKKIETAFDAGIGELADTMVDFGKKFVAVDTGRLKKSIKSSRVKTFLWHFKSGGPTVPYAVLQELGHFAGLKYKFTPFMRPAVLKTTNNKGEFDQAFSNRLKDTPEFATAVRLSEAMSSIDFSSLRI